MGPPFCRPPRESLPGTGRFRAHGVGTRRLDELYTVRDGALVEVGIFEADQYTVDELMAKA